MLAQNSSNRTIQNTILRALLPHIIQNQEYYRQLSTLGHIASVYYCIDSKSIIKEKRRCIICEQQIDNLLMLILHLEVLHQNQNLIVEKYQYTYQTLTIYMISSLKEIKNGPNFNFLICLTKKDSFLQHSLTQRAKIIMDNISYKLTKKIEQVERIYFHSYDVFRKVEASSQQEDSQEEAGMIQQQLQKLRISEFNDVNENDKLFFMKWNELMHVAKKKYTIIDQTVIMNIMQKLVVVCKKNNVPRMNLIMHLWTLWSTGKICSANIISIISLFDREQQMDIEK